jgi:hypothetical protein
MPWWIGCVSVEGCGHRVSELERWVVMKGCAERGQGNSDERCHLTTFRPWLHGCSARER